MRIHARIAYKIITDSIALNPNWNNSILLFLRAAGSFDVRYGLLHGVWDALNMNPSHILYWNIDKFLIVLVCFWWIPLENTYLFVVIWVHRPILMEYDVFPLMIIRKICGYNAYKAIRPSLFGFSSLFSVSAVQAWLVDLVCSQRYWVTIVDCL